MTNDQTKPKPLAPVADPVPSFWNTDPRYLDDFQSTKDLPSEADILIVGSGIAGVGTAYHLLQDSCLKPSITILEARKTASGATGRNGGHVKPDGFLNVPRTAEIYGMEAAAELAKFEAAHVYAVKALVERENLDCDFNITRALDVFLDPKHAKQTEEAVYAQEKRRKSEVCPIGSINAQKVIFATNGYTGHLLPEYARCIVPIRGIASHISSPKGTNTPHLVNTYGIRFDAINNDYLIPRPDGSIIVGGARQRFWHDKERWYGTVRDDELIDEAVSYFDDYMQRHFRGWENSGAKVESTWTGIMGYSGDFMPHVGEVPDKPGQFIIAGFTGHGMPQILLSSKGLAAMVRGGVSFESSGLPRIFKTTKARIYSQRNLIEESLKPQWKTGSNSKL
ncbi:hypothetical protein FSARC_13220 [Fusarium sarcochroum]|uniref:FAD dependent oxidoreductase domain-containing protein n=1 Tax=Fusarium sarcochroum TaxID=1208366 RepID=A0A8H4WUH1_9HYPO|nr:hypothetical protein FSARC_13220 [Fusarium sarcochroum]